MNMDNQPNIYDALWDPREYLRETGLRRRDDCHRRQTQFAGIAVS